MRIVRKCLQIASVATVTVLLTILALSLPPLSRPTYSLQNTTQETFSPLVIKLLHEQQSVRDKALQELKASGNAVPILEQALNSPDWQIRVIAAYHLGQLGSEAVAAVSALAISLADQHPDVRFSVAQALGKIGSGLANLELLAALEDSDESVRIAATDALLKLVETLRIEQLSLLNKTLAKEISGCCYPQLNFQFRYHERSLSGLEIAFARHEQITESLVLALGHKNWFIRQTAANNLEERLATDDRLIRQLLVSYLRHGYTRSIIAELLADLDRNRLVALSQTQDDKLALIYLLGVSGSNEVLPELVHYLHSNSTIAAAAAALGQIGTPEAMSVLVQEAGIDYPHAFAGRHSEVLAQEFYRLLTSQERATRQSLLGLLAGSSLESFPNLADAIRQMPTEQAIEILIPELKNSDSEDSFDSPDIRIGALVLLNELPQDSVITAIHKHLSPIESFAVFYEWTVFRDEIGLAKEFLLGNRDTVLRMIDFSLQLLSQLQKDSDISSERYDLQQLIQILDYLARAGSPEAKAGLLKLMTYSNDLIEVLDPQFVLSIAELGYPSEMETTLAREFWKIWDDVDSSLSPEDILFQLKIIDVLDDYSLEKKLIPIFLETYSDELYYSDLEDFRLNTLEQIRQDVIEVFLGLNSYWEIGDIDIRQMQNLSIDIERYMPLILESLEQQGYIWEGRLSHSRAILLLLLDNRYVEVAIDAAFQLLERSTWQPVDDGADILYAIDFLLETIETASKYSEEYRAVLATELSLPYESSVAIQIALQDKDADYRRTIALAIGKQENVPEADIVALQETMSNPLENLQVRWMAAAVLDRLGYNTDRFFFTHHLFHPRLLKSSLCSYDSLSVGLTLTVTAVPTDDELLYFGRCAYGLIEEGGGPWTGIYKTIKKLLSRVHESDSP